MAPMNDTSTARRADISENSMTTTNIQPNDEMGTSEVMRYALGRLRRPAPRHDNSGYDKRDQEYSSMLALRRRENSWSRIPSS